MCFSATASFAAAGVLTATGLVSVRRARRVDSRQGLLLLAAFPLVFGVQQGLEGLVWLSIEGTLTPWLRPVAGYGFLFFALFFWPVAGPLAGHLIETDPVRRRLFAPMVAGGAALGAYLLTVAVSLPAQPTTGPEWGGHIVYLLQSGYRPFLVATYFVTASAALLASSNRHAFRFGVTLALSFAVTVAAYHGDALISVWCFFAALCSLVIAVSLLRAPEAPTVAAAR